MPSQQDARRVRNDLENESIFGMLASHFAVHYPERTELPIAPHVVEKPLFAYWQNNWCEQLSQALGVPIARITQMRGHDLRRPDKEYCHCSDLATGLRYCLECLRAGYHSVVFQHYAVTHCPAHRSRLLETCLSCNREIEPTVTAIRECSMTCPHCGQALSTLHSQRQARLDVLEQDRVLGAIREELAKFAQANTSCSGIDSLARRGEATTPRARQVLRLLGADQRLSPISSWSFQSERFQVIPGEVLRDWRDLTADELASPLKWLSQNCPGADDAVRLGDMAGMSYGSCSLEAQSSVIGAMLFKTLFACGLVDEFKAVHTGECVARRGRKFPPQVALRSTSPTYCEAARCRIYHLEVMSLLARLLVSCRPGRPLIEIDFTRVPPSLSWMPSWTSTGNEEKPGELVVRSRVNEALLLRLMRRYEGKEFVCGPSEVAPHRLLA